MVQRSTSAETAPETSENDPLAFEMDDSTPTEVQAEEARFFGEFAEESAEPESTEQGASETDEAGAEAEPSESPQQAEQQPQEPAEEPQPESTVFTEEQVREREAAAKAAVQAAKDKELAERDRRLAELEKRVQSFDLDKEVEAELRRQEARLEPQYGSEEARRIVRSQDNVDTVRQGREAQLQLKQAEAQQRIYAEQQEQYAKATVAQQFMQQYNVSGDDLEVLMATTTPQAMEQVAKRLGSANVQRSEKSAQTKEAVPRETPETALENGRSTTQAPTNEDDRVDQLLNTKTYDQMSDEEYELVTRRQRAR